MEQSALQCFVCHGQLVFLGSIPIRTGGTSGGWHLLLGEWADAGEKLITLDMYRCNTCRRVDSYDLDLSLPAR